MFSLVLIFGLVVCALYAYLKPRRPTNFPPGPPSYPLVGSGVALSKLGTYNFEKFGKLEQLYGPVSSVFLGNLRTIIINGYEATKEFYTKDDFPDRPNVDLINSRWGGRQLGIFFSNGRLWQEQRRFTLRHLRDFGFGKKSMEGLIHEEAQACVENIQKVSSTTETGVISIHDRFGVAILNMLWAIMSGVRYNYHDDKCQKLLKIVQDSIRAGNPAGIVGGLLLAYPVLKRFPFFKDEYAKLVSGSDNVVEMLKETIREHEQTRDSTSPRDFIDVYLQAMEDNKDDPETTFSRDQLAQICVDMFTAGSESTSNTVAFAVLHMIRNPECQEKVQAELDSVIGKERAPAYQDRNRLPYTLAAVTESLRMNPVAPLSVMHVNAHDVKLMGYDIPKGTWAMANFTTTNMNKAYWGDPEIYRPERFIAADGSFNKERLSHVLDFGAGKRQCLGEPLARMCNFILFASVMQKFTFDIPSGHTKPTTDPVDGFTVAPQPFAARVSIRI